MNKLFAKGRKGVSMVMVLSMILALSGPFVVYPSVAKAVTVVGPNGGLTFINDSTVGTEVWSNPSNAQTSNGGWATVGLRGEEKSNYLKATNFGFNIPTGATINGIEINIERNNDNGNANKIFDNSIKLVKNGTIGGSDKANPSTVFWPPSDAVATYGNSADLWGTTWTASDINNINTGVAISAMHNNTDNSSRFANIDYISMTIYYTSSVTTGSLTVTKTTLGGDGTFNFTGDTGLFQITTSSGTGNNLRNNLTPGTYSVTETVPSGWSKIGDTCQNVTVTSNNTAECTITNTKLPTLTLVKMVNNNFGGTKVVSDFTLRIDGNIVTSEVSNTLTIGTHTASEVSLSGYSASDWEGDCAADGSITLAAGDNKTCTITNDDIQPKLTVTKVVVNNDNGALDVSDFPLFVNGNSVDSEIQNAFNAGQYTISETQQSGYFGTIGGDCAADGTITLNVGDIKNCTITNDDVAPGLTVIKNVVNNDGGTLLASDFQLYIDDTPVTSGQSNTLPAGSYVVKEDVVAGYQGTIGGDCDANGNVTLSVGETKVCTITNDDIQPKLTVTKVVVNDNGGTKVVADFPLFVGATSVISGTQTGFNQGTYVVSETNQTGYVGVITGDCDAQGNITLALGDVKTCNITNDDQQGALTIKKVVINDDNGTKVASDFSFSINGGNAVTFEADGQNDVSVDAGTYEITEPTASGYTTTYENCSSVVVANGGTVTCTITNNDIAPTQGSLTVTKVVVNDNGGTKQVGDFTLLVGTTQVTSAEATQFTQGNYVVSETGSSGYNATFSGDCNAQGNITIKPNQSYACTITNDDIQPKLTVTKVVVNDNGGTKVISDFPLFVGATSVTSGVQTGFNAGSYVVSETNQTGYSGVITGDCDAQGNVALGLGDVKTCTVTNDDIAPTPTPNPTPAPAPAPTSSGGGGGGGVALFIFQTHTITALSDINGSITPSGTMAVNYGANATFSITPNSGFQVANVVVDGVSVGAVNTYTFTNVVTNHTISATFSGVLGTSTVSTQTPPANNQNPVSNNNPVTTQENNPASNQTSNSPENSTTEEPSLSGGNLQTPTQSATSEINNSQVAALGEATGLRTFLNWITSNWSWLLLLIILLIIAYYIYRRWQENQEKK